jgi:hypothetical protein
MAVETIRRSGYRVVGGVYLTSPTLYTCYPQPLKRCPTCGEGPNLSRFLTSINPSDFFEERCDRASCFMCNSRFNAEYLAVIGKHYYPTVTTFIEEAARLGVSKRVPFIPSGVVLHKTIIYLAHERALKEGFGVFGYFIVNQIEKLVWASEVPETPDAKVTFICIPDGDMDHSSYKSRKLLKVPNII